MQSPKDPRVFDRTWAELLFDILCAVFFPLGAYHWYREESKTQGDEEASCLLNYAQWGIATLFLVCLCGKWNSHSLLHTAAIALCAALYVTIWREYLVFTNRKLDEEEGERQRKLRN